MKIGDKVKLNKNIEIFRYGKGGVNYDEIGIIIGIGCGKVKVNFPNCSVWNGRKSELVLCNEKFFKKLPNNFTGTLEVKNGYIVEKEILDDVEKEYLLNVIKPFRNKVIYIAKRSFCSDESYITIKLNNELINLPFFKKGTMYKGMEAEKIYTLKELGL